LNSLADGPLVKRGVAWPPRGIHGKQKKKQQEGSVTIPNQIQKNMTPERRTPSFQESNRGKKRAYKKKKSQEKGGNWKDSKPGDLDETPRRFLSLNRRKRG